MFRGEAEAGGVDRDAANEPAVQSADADFEKDRGMSKRAKITNTISLAVALIAPPLAFVVILWIFRHAP